MYNTRQWVARQDLAAFAGLHALDDPDERRASPAKVSRCSRRSRSASLRRSRVSPRISCCSRAPMLTDGVLADLAWLSPAAAAIALFELAQALPPGAERRELGRRVLTRLREADRDTFVRLLIALARISPSRRERRPARAARGRAVRAAHRARCDRRARIRLFAQPSLAQSWIEVPATGASRAAARRTPARTRCARSPAPVRRWRPRRRARARPPRCARRSTGCSAIARRSCGGSRASRAACSRTSTPSSPTISIASSVHRDQHRDPPGIGLGGCGTRARRWAERWAPLLIERAMKEPGVARGTILGLAGLAIAAPGDADACSGARRARAARGGRSTRGAPARGGLAAVAGRDRLALAWTRTQLLDPTASADDGRWALLEALDPELADAEVEGLGVPIAAAHRARCGRREHGVARGPHRGRGDRRSRRLARESYRRRPD